MHRVNNGLPCGSLRRMQAVDEKLTITKWGPNMKPEFLSTVVLHLVHMPRLAFILIISASCGSAWVSVVIDYIFLTGIGNQGNLHQSTVSLSVVV